MAKKATSSAVRVKDLGDKDVEAIRNAKPSKRSVALSKKQAEVLDHDNDGAAGGSLSKADKAAAEQEAIDLRRTNFGF